MKWAEGVTVSVLSGRGSDQRHASATRGADKGTLLAGNGFLLTGGGQMSPARLLRLAGLVSLAASVLLVLTQLFGSLAFVVVDDPGG